MRLAILAASLLLAACASEGRSIRFGDERRVLVVANASDPASGRLARRYVEARGISESRLLMLRCARREEIDRATYAREIEGPLAQWWARCGANDRPQYLLLIRGLPLKIRGTGGREATQSSVDSELTLLPRISRGEFVAPGGRMLNPYYQPTHQGPYDPFDPRRFDQVLVCRLDAFTEAECESLIARSVRATRARGTVLLDERAEGRGEAGDLWLREAARSLEMRDDVEARLDSTALFVQQAERLLGYASWGSNDAGYRRDCAYAWLPGALAATYVSTSARSFREPPADWTPARSSGESSSFAGSSQSLIGDLLRSGATGASGAVYEPYLDGCVRPDFLFPAYLEGRTLGESFYLAMPFLSWMSVMVGDPLCAPFAATPPAEPTR